MPNALTTGPLLAALLFCLPAATAAGSDEVSRLSIQAWVDIDADGRISTLEWITELPAALRTAAEAEIKLVEYLPATIDGKPAASRSELRGSLIMSPSADEVILSIERLRVGAGVNRLFPSSYPDYALRNRTTATVMAEFTVTVDGKAEDIAIYPEQREQDFGEQIRAALARWRFEPERLRNSPVASSLCVPFTFAIAGRPLPPAPDPALCRRERSLASSPGQSPLWETIGISARGMR